MSRKWYKKLTNGDEDALFKKIDVKESDIPVCLEEKHPIEGEKPIKNFAKFTSEYDLLMEIKNTPVNKRCFYEIIRGGHYQKHYTDIDCTLEDDPFTDPYPHTIEEKINIAKVLPIEYRDAVIKLKPEIKVEDIMIFNSNSNKKRSFHIVIDRWCFTSATQNKDFFNEVMEQIPLPHRKYFDNRMYKCHQQFRIFLSTKCGKDRYKLIDPMSTWKCSDSDLSPFQLLKEMFNASLITSTSSSCRIISYKYREKIDYLPSRDMENNELSACINIFRKFKDSSSFDVMDIKGTLIPLRRRCASYCDVCCRTHDTENGYLYLTFNNDLYFNCRRNDSSTLIGNIYSEDQLTRQDSTNASLSVYVAPTIGYNVEVTSFIDSGILNLSTVKQISHEPIIESQIHKEITVNLPEINFIRKKETKIIPVSDGEISEFSNRIREAKMRHSKGPKSVKPDRVLSRAFNSMAII